MESQGHSSGNLVDVLAAGSAAAGNREVQFVFGYFEAVNHRNQSTSSSCPNEKWVMLK
jgi:hypothetical protein